MASRVNCDQNSSYHGADPRKADPFDYPPNQTKTEGNTGALTVPQTEPKSILLIGDSGAGKSTICSTIAGEAGLFKSGFFEYTKDLECRERNGYYIMDTPEVEEEKSAEAIKEALVRPCKNPDNEASVTVLCVACCLGLRVKPETIATPNLIMRAINTRMPKKYHFVMNRVGEGTIERIIRTAGQEISSDGLDFLHLLSFFDHPPQSIILIPMVFDIMCSDNQILSEEMIVLDRDLNVQYRSKDWSKILNSLEPMTYSLADVEDLQLRECDYQKQSQIYLGGLQERSKAQTAAGIKARDARRGLRQLKEPVTDYLPDQTFIEESMGAFRPETSLFHTMCNML